MGGTKFSLQILKFDTSFHFQFQKGTENYFGFLTYALHSVLERIWIKGSYLGQWLPQGERRPPKESKSRWIEIFQGGSH